MLSKPQTKAIGAAGALIALGLLAAPLRLWAQSVCAVVKLEILQTATLERQGFDAHLAVSNNVPTAPLTNLKVQIFIKDAAGNPADSLFFVKTATLTNVNAVDGTGIVQSSSTADIHWLIIPSTGAGGTNPAGQRYGVSAIISALSNNVPQNINTFSAFITVQPQPAIKLEYALPFEVFADEPLTPQIEPVEPFPLAVRVTNVGYGTANNFQIQSAQPRILDNKQGLQIDFKLLGTNVGGQTIPNTLLIPFGNVAPQQASQAWWIMSTVLSGRFTSFTSTFTHAADLGGQLTSLIQSVTTYTLLKDVLIDLPGRDTVPDFLVNETADRGSMQALLDAGTQPPAQFILESDQPTPIAVTEVPGMVSGALGGTSAALTFRFAQGVSSNVWVHSYAPFTFGNSVSLVSATRGDGKVLNPRNVWISKHFVKSTLQDVYWVNVLDLTSSTNTYTLQFNPNGLDVPPGAVKDLAAVTVSSGGSLGLTWSAPGEDGYTGYLFGGRYFFDAELSSAAAFSPNSAQANITTSTPAGAAQGYVLSNLVGNATYYVALFTQDTGGNMSALSNVATAYTLPNPPNGLVLSNVAKNGLTASWQGGNNSLPVEYSVFLTTRPGGPVVSSSPYQDSFHRSYAFSGLSLLTTYYVYGVAAATATGIASPVALLGSTVTPSGLDLLPPRTTLAAGTPSFSASPALLYAAQATTFTLSAVDDAVTAGDGAGVGVARTALAIDTTTFYPYLGSFGLVGEGTHTVSYFSVDLVGHAESSRTLAVDVDLTPPITAFQVFGSSAVDASGHVEFSSITPVGFAAVDPVSSGVASGVSATSYAIDADPASPACRAAAPNPGAPAGTCANPAYGGPFTLALGTHTIYYFSQDRVGNRESERSLVVDVRADALPPRTTLVAGAPSFSTGTIVYATAVTAFGLTAVDDARAVGDAAGVGVARSYVAVDTSAYSVYAGTFSLAAEGVHAVSYYSVDLASNTELASTTTIGVDLTAPITSLQALGPSAASAGGVFVSSFTPLALSASDPVSKGVASGVGATFVAVDSGPYAAYAGPLFLSTGAHSVAFYSQDKVGNRETPNATTVFVDTVPPSTALSLLRGPQYLAAGATIPYVSAGTYLLLVATDPAAGGFASGVANVSYTDRVGGQIGTQNSAGSPSLLARFQPTEGLHTLIYASVDRAGNAEIAKSTQAWLDMIPPVSTATIGRPQYVDAGGNVFITSFTPISFAAVDPTLAGSSVPGSGLSRIEIAVDTTVFTAYVSTLTVPQGPHSIAYRAVDNVGNVEAQVHYVPFQVPPPPAPAVAYGGSSSGGGSGPTYVSTSALSFSGSSPNGPGVASVQYSINGGAFQAASSSVTLPEGSYQVTVQVADLLGVVSDRTITVNVDLTPPVTQIGFTGPVSTSPGGGFAFPANSAVFLTAQDPVSSGVASGVAQTFYAVDAATPSVYSSAFTLSVGTHTLTYYSVDNVGNVESARAASVAVSSPVLSAVASADGVATLSSYVFGEALTAVPISSQPAASAALAQHLTPATSFYDLSPSGVAFAPAATLSFRLAPAVSASALAIYYFNGVAWDSAPISGQSLAISSSAAVLLSGKLAHASLYAVLGPIPAPTLTAISVAPSSATLAAGGTLQFTASGTFSDGSTQTVTAAWTSDAPSVATVTAAGLATALSAGTARVIASSGPLSASAVVTVTVPAPTLTSISVLPSSAALTSGATQAFVAVGYYSDGSSRTLAGLGSWTAGPSLPQAIGGAATVFVNGKFYLFSGSPQVSLAYDPSAGTWTTLAAPPVNRGGAGAAAVGGVIYVFGGCVNNDCSNTTVANWAYDTVANAWTQKSPMITARFSPTAAAINGKVYAAAGGTSPFTPTATLEAYDPSTDRWTSLAPMPLARIDAGGAAIGGKLYVAGGTDNSAYQPLDPRAEAAVYDPAANAWSPAAPIPERVFGPGSAALGGRLYLVGGQHGDGSISTATWVYDAAAGAWSAGPFLSAARLNASAAGGNGLILAAGAVNGGSSAAVETLSIGPGVAWSSDAPSVATVTAAGVATGLTAGTARVIASTGALTAAATLTVLPPAPSVTSVAPSSATAGATLGLVVTGTGFDPSAALSLESLDVLRGSWTAAAAMPTARMGPVGVLLKDGRVLAVGGYLGSGTILAAAEIYDPASGTWTAAASMSTPRLFPAVVLLADGRVLIAGGRTGGITGPSASSSEIYDPAANAWTPAGSLSTARERPMTAILPDGRVLAAGGYNNSGLGFLATTEIYDSATGTWKAGPSMASGHGAGQMTRLTDGRFLVAGGAAGPGVATAAAEIYDPATSAWSPAGAMTNTRFAFAMQRLPDGRVVAAGGESNSGVLVNTSDVYDPATNAWTAGPSMSAARQVENSVVIGGRMAVVGGIYNGVPLASVEVYDAEANAWRAGPTLGTARYNEALVTLADGRVLTAGGQTASGAEIASAEILGASTTAIAAAGVSVADAAHLSGTANLTGAATGYWDVVVRESGGRVGRLPGGFRVAAPPSPVSDLAFANVGPVSATLTWTAPASQAALASYDLRVATFPITAGNFAAASPVAAPAPAAAGTAQAAGVAVGGPIWYAALQSRDSLGGISGLSNVAGLTRSTITIGGVPELVFSAGQPVVQTLLSTSAGNGAVVLASATAQGLVLVSGVYDLGPEKAVFSPPASLTIAYSTAALRALGLAPADLLIYEYVAGSGWVAVASQTPNASAQSVTASVPTLASIFALLGRPHAPPLLALALASGTTVAASAPVLVARYAAAAYPLDLASVRLRLDGVDVSSLTAVAASSAQFAAAGLVSGAHAANAAAADAWGAVSTAALSFLVDAAPPVSALSVGAPQYASSGTVYVSTLTPLALSAVDPIVNGVASGVRGISITQSTAAFAAYAGTFTLAAPDGTKTLAWFATDNVGNQEVVKSSALVLDATAPQTSLLIVGGRQYPGPDAASFYASSATRFALPAVDPLVNGAASGVAWTKYQDGTGAFLTYVSTFALAEGAHALAYQSQDNVANLEVLRSTNVWIDATPPVTAVSVGSPTYTAADGTVYVTPASPVTFAAADPALPTGQPGSGVARIEVSVDSAAFAVYTASLTFAEGRHIVAYRSVDNVGNIEATRTLALQSDATPPQTTLQTTGPWAGATSTAGASGAVLTARATTPLPAGCNGFGLVAYNGRVYTAGCNGSNAPGVFSAPISADGTIGAWRTETNQLPYGVEGGPALTQWNGRLYFAGGYNYVVGGTQNAVWAAPVNADGTVGTWVQQANALPTPINGNSLAAWNGRLYSVGGSAYAQGSVAAAYSAAVAADGSVGTWTTATSLPQPLSWNGVFAYNGYVYTVGGLNATSPASAVYSAAVNADGSLGAWATQAPLPQAMSNTRATAVSGGRVYVVGGCTGGQCIQTIYSAPLGAGGAVGAWRQENMAMPVTVGNAALVAWNGELIVAGADASSKAVYMLALSAAPSFGGYASAATLFALSAVDPVSNDVASGVAFTRYRVNGGAFATSPLSFHLAGPDGAYAIDYQSQDNVTNLETQRTTSVLLDQTPPVTTVSIGSPTYTAADGTAYVTPTTPVTFAAADPNLPSGQPGSGVSRIEVALDGGAFSVYGATLTFAEGRHTILYRAVDNVGNVEATKTLSLQSDATPPITAFKASGNYFTASAPEGTRLYAPLSFGYSLPATDPVVNNVASGLAFTRYRTGQLTNYASGSPTYTPGAFANYVSTFALGEGIRRVDFQSQDNVTNLELLKSATVFVDATPPVTTLTVGAPQYAAGGTLFVSTVTPFVLAAQDPVVQEVASGVAGIFFHLDANPFAPYSSTFTIPVPDGFHSASFYAVDNVGNLETVKTSTVALDATPPLTSLALLGGHPFVGPDNLTFYASADTRFALPAFDPVVNGAASGVALTRWQDNGGAFAAYVSTFALAEGAHALGYQSQDHVANLEVLRSTNAWIDATPPVTTFAFGAPYYQAPDGTNYVTPATPISFSAVDPSLPTGQPGSGVNHIEVAIDGGAFTVYTSSLTFAEGRHTILYRSIDNVANVEATKTLNVQSDATPPITALALVGGHQFPGPDSVSFYASADTRYGLPAVDPVVKNVASGVAWTRWQDNGGSFQVFASTFALAEGVHHLGYQSQDNVQNLEVLRSTTALVDATAPITTISIVGGHLFPGPDASTFYASADTRFALPAVDPVVSGVASGLAFTRWQDNGGAFAAYVSTFALAEGAHVLGYQSQDHVANLEVLRSTNAWIDATPPVTTVAIGSPTYTAPDGTIYVTPATPISFAATDPNLPSGQPGAGVNRIEVALDGGAFAPYSAALKLPEGRHVILYRAIDNVANVEASHALAVQSDATPPVSALVIGSPQYQLPNVLLVSSRTPFGVSAVDPISNNVASGVKDSWYNVNDIAPSTGAFAQFMSSFTLSGVDVNKVIQFYSRDNVLNTEIVKSSTVLLDSTPPEISLLSPAACDSGICRVLKGKLPILGTATDAHFAGYRLDFAPGQNATTGYTLVSSGTVAVSSGALGTWDASALAGWQTLRLTATDLVQNVSVLTINVFVGDPATLMLLGNHDTFDMPTGVAVGTDGKIYVADRDNDRIAVFTSTGGLSAVFGGRHDDHWDDDRVSTSTLRLHEPAGVAVDAASNIYVADTGHQRVLKLSPSGQVLLDLGRRKIERDDGALKTEFASGKAPGEFRHPLGVAVDSLGSIYVADTGNSRVQVFTSTGGFASQFALPALPAIPEGDDREAGEKDDDAPALGRPAGVAVDAAGSIYVADLTGRRALRYDPSGRLTLMIPIPGDKPGAAGRPYGVAVSTSGDCLLVSDMQFAHVLKFDMNGAQNLIFGARARGDDDHAPKPTAIPLRKPAGLALDAAGNLYVADRNAEKIEKFGLPNGQATVVVPPPGPGDDDTARDVVSRDDGGTVERKDKAAVAIPAQALSDDLKVSVSTPTADVAAAGAKTAADANLKTASPPVDFGPEGTKFQAPVTLTLPYSSDLLAQQNGDETSLKVHYWNKDKGQWEELATQVDEQDHTVTAKTTHFSLYQVFATSASALKPLATADPTFTFHDGYAFPNPVRGTGAVTLRIQPGLADSVEVHIYDLSGRKVHSSSDFTQNILDDGNGKGSQYTFDHVWNVSGVGSGVYMYVITAKKAGMSDIHKSGKIGVVK